MGQHGTRSAAITLACLAAMTFAPPSASALAQRSFGNENFTPQSAILDGTVRTETGKVVRFGVNVRLDTGEGLAVEQQPADSEGRFHFAGLRKTSYRLVVTAPGYATVEQTVNLGYGANQYFVTITLTPSAQRPSQVPPPALSDLRAPKQARHEYQKGARALKGRHWRQAQSHFEKAVEIDSCYARAQTDLATVLIAQRQAAAGEAALRKAIACDPDYLDAYMELGQCLNARKQFTEAKTVLQDGLRRSPSSWQFYYQLGVAEFGEGKYQDAEQSFLKAESFQAAAPPDVHVKLADVYVKEKAYDKAYQEMDAYLRADPQGRFASRIRSIMRQMEQAGVLHPGDRPASPPKP